MLGNFIPTWKYFWIACEHRWFVFRAGRWTRASLWRRLVHDWTKFLPRDMAAYGRQFFGAADRPEEFARAWGRHQNSHDHHWEFWINRTKSEPIPASMSAVREMVADWLGAGKAYNGEWPDVFNWEWLDGARPRMLLHELTAERIDRVITELKVKSCLPGVLGSIESIFEQPAGKRARHRSKRKS